MSSSRMIRICAIAEGAVADDSSSKELIVEKGGIYG